MDSGVPTGHNIDTNMLRLDLYRLNCIFEASQSMALKCDDHFTCPTRSLLDDFESDEVSLLVISISIFGRMLDDKQKLLAENKPDLSETISQIKESQELVLKPVGILISDRTDETVFVNLTLREAFNKVLHTKKMNFDIEDGEHHVNRYLRSYLHLYGSKWEKEWKATLHIYDFIKSAYCLSVYF